MNDLLKTLIENPMVVGAIGLASTGLVTFWIKDFPRRVIAFIKRHVSTDITITNTHKAYHDFLKWVEVEFKDKNFRRLKITNGAWGWQDDATTSLGYGKHWIKYNGKWIIVELTKDTANQSSHDKESITITKLGRSREVFDKMIQDIGIRNENKDMTKIYKMEDRWEYTKEQNIRSLDSVFIESEKKNKLVNRLSDFIKREDWYVKNGIPYQLGILLYGNPGTGKTSLIKAIAGYLNYPIYYISPKNLNKIEIAMASLPNKCLVVIEDMDSNSLTHMRKKKVKSGDPISNAIEDMSAVSLSEVLNSLDGLFSAHGRILLATTNHIEKLDPAMIRHGRIDVKIEIGFVTNETLNMFMDRFYPDSSYDCNMKIKDNITVSELQNMVMENKTSDYVLEYMRALD